MGDRPHVHKESDTPEVTPHTGTRGAHVALDTDLWRLEDGFSLHWNTLFYVLSLAAVKPYSLQRS